MWTDAEPARARELVHEMEALRRVIVGVAFPTAANAGRILVVALGDDEELSLLRGSRDERSFAIADDTPLRQPIIVLTAFSSYTREDELLTHELTQALSSSTIHHQPRWLAEGMAIYFQTLQRDIDRTTVHVGVPPRNPGARPRRMAHLVPASELLAWRRGGPLNVRSGLYSTAWALFTFLINEHREELLRYLQRLDDPDRPPEEPAHVRGLRVWSEAFPSLPLEAVDRELRRWLISGQHLVMHFKLEPRAWPITERLLHDVDVYALRGFLLAEASRTSESLDNVKAALAIDPRHVLARFVGWSYHEMAISPLEGRALAAAHPDDWHAWWLAADAIHHVEGETAEVAAAKVKACELIARNPVVVAPPKLCPERDNASASH